jgi:hypothetical protein
VGRVADREKLSLLLDKARQFAGEYIDSLEERPVFPGEKSLRAMDALIEPLPENPSDPLMVLVATNCFVDTADHPGHFTSSAQRAGGVDADNAARWQQA